MGFAESVNLKTRKERIGPYIITGVVYLSLYVQLMRAQSAPVYQAAVLGSLITIFGGFFINNFEKISMHAAGVGGLVSFVGVLIMHFSDHVFHVGLPSGELLVVPTSVLMPASLVLAGIVCSSRAILKAHNLKQIYIGALLGFIAQLIAFNIVL